MRSNKKKIKAAAFLFLSVLLLAAKPAGAKAAGKPRISKTKITVTVGKTKRLKIKNRHGRKVKWRSSNKKVATVTKNGKIEAKKAGKTTITAKIGKRKLKCRITVKVSINKKKAALKEGWTLKLKIKGLGKGVKWRSSDPSVAVVKKTGKRTAVVTGIKKGKCTITARKGKNKVKCTVLVKHPISKCTRPEGK